MNEKNANDEYDKTKAKIKLIFILMSKCFVCAINTAGGLYGGQKKREILKYTNIFMIIFSNNKL